MVFQMLSLGIIPMNSYYIQKGWVWFFFLVGVFFGGEKGGFCFFSSFFCLIASSQFCSVAVGVGEMTKQSIIWAAAGF